MALPPVAEIRSSGNQKTLLQYAPAASRRRRAQTRSYLHEAKRSRHTRIGHPKPFPQMQGISSHAVAKRTSMYRVRSTLANQYNRCMQHRTDERSLGNSMLRSRVSKTRCDRPVTAPSSMRTARWRMSLARDKGPHHRVFAIAQSHLALWNPSVDGDDADRLTKTRT